MSVLQIPDKPGMLVGRRACWDVGCTELSNPCLPDDSFCVASLMESCAWDLELCLGLSVTGDFAPWRGLP